MSKNMRDIKRIINLITIFLIAFASTSFASDQAECRFMEDAKHQIELDPENLATSNFETNNILFYSVGAGFAGIVPCFEKMGEFDCANNSYKIVMIWVGGDVITCEGQSELGKKVIDWAKRYNCRLKYLLIEQNQYKCGM